MIIRRKLGFTLIELLVVVAIIAILSVIGLVIFSGAQANARDARRKSDIDAIAAALETKRGVGGVFYQPLVDTDFNGGAIPSDTTTAKYCISLGTSDTAGSTNPTVFDQADGCPLDAGSVLAGGMWDPAIAALGFKSLPNALAPFGDGAAVTTLNKKSWKICAKLETTSTPNVYCKNSAQ